MEQIIQMLLSDIDCLLELCKSDFEEVTEYQLFVRCLSDQTVVENEKRRLRTKEDGTMNSSALQNPPIRMPHTEINPVSSTEDMPPTLKKP